MFSISARELQAALCLFFLTLLLGTRVLIFFALRAPLCVLRLCFLTFLLSFFLVFSDKFGLGSTLNLLVLEGFFSVSFLFFRTFR